MPPTPRVALVPIAEPPAAPTQARVAAPPPPAPPAVVEEPRFDPEQEERIVFAIQVRATGKTENAVIRELMRTFAVPRHVAKADLDAAMVELRRRLDDEGAIDAVAWGALANIQVLRERFTKLALAEVPTRIRDVPAPIPADPTEPYDPDGEGATFRALTPSEHAAAVAARAQSAKIALTANELLVKIAGRRSQRWAERPQNVVIATGGGGLSEEDKKLLETLGMMSR